MYVCDLALDYFRSYRNLVLSGIKPGINVFLGANGQGKTNLLEALNYLAVLSSHRVGVDAALVFKDFSVPEDFAIASGQSAGNVAVTRARVVREARSELLEIEIIAGKANRAMINRHATRPRELLGHLTTVMFAPEDMQIVRGEPGIRRVFLDTIAMQLWPALASVLADYTKVMRQRAAYLKDLAKKHSVADPWQIDVWNQALAPLAAEIMWQRESLVVQLQRYLPSIYKQISSTAQSQPELIYRDSVSNTLGWQQEKTQDNSSAEARVEAFRDKDTLREKILQALRSRQNEEERRGVNLVGPHRDELELRLNSFPVKGFASHGETWSFILALRLAQFQVMQDYLAETPLLLLDDVFAELDTSRRSALMGAIEKAEQVWVTSALGTELPPELKAQFFQVTQDENHGTQVIKRGEGAASQVTAPVNTASTPTSIDSNNTNITQRTHELRVTTTTSGEEKGE